MVDSAHVSKLATRFLLFVLVMGFAALVVDLVIGISGGNSFINFGNSNDSSSNNINNDSPNIDIGTDIFPTSQPTLFPTDLAPLDEDEDGDDEDGENNSNNTNTTDPTLPPDPDDSSPDLSDTFIDYPMPPSSWSESNTKIIEFDLEKYLRIAKQRNADDNNDDDDEKEIVNLGIMLVPNSLCTLTMLDVRGDYIPIARSYDGRPWELSAGPFNNARNNGNNDDYGGMIVACDAIKCAIDFAPALRVVANTATSFNTTAQFHLTSYSAYLDTQGSNHVNDRKALVARFLEQTT